MADAEAEAEAKVLSAMSEDVSKPVVGHSLVQMRPRGFY